MSGWTKGNQLRLLENGEEYFPRICEAVRAARKEVVLETFLWCEDEVGLQLRDVLAEAAQRGVQVRVLVDGYGSPGFSKEFLTPLADAGAEVRSFDPRPRFFRLRTNLLCRMHRKIVVVDAAVAFVGGINFKKDHLRSFGARSKQDYSVEVTGPVVKDIHKYCRFGHDVHAGSWRRRWRYWLRRFPREMMNPQEGAQVLFAIRDNAEHPTDIETMYRVGIRNARESVVIANAYFFPGYRFIRDLRAAAERGVDVVLIMQGNPDRPVSVGAASLLYDDLLSMGIRIVRYTERPLHAKVAVIDDRWASVGSSNLDPFSLGLNLEANLFILDPEFNAVLRNNLDQLVRHYCEELSADQVPRRSRLRRLLLTFGYHVTRKMPSWRRHVLWHEQHIRPVRPTGSGEKAG
ncbi:MAG: cardiolipin synthase ClsB [Woeseia sp.]